MYVNKYLQAYVQIYLVAEGCRRGCSVPYKHVKKIKQKKDKEIQEMIDKVNVHIEDEDDELDCTIINKSYKVEKYEKLLKKNEQYAIAVVLDYIGKNYKHIVKKQRQSYTIHLIGCVMNKGNEVEGIMFLMSIISGNKIQNIVKTLKHVQKIAEKANTRCNYVKKYKKKIKYTMYVLTMNNECIKEIQECKSIIQEYQKKINLDFELKLELRAGG